MNAPDIVFLESNTSGTGRLFALTARRLGFTPFVLTNAPDRYSFLSHDAIEFAKCDTSSPGAIDNALQERLNSNHIAGITSTSDYYVDTAARLARSLNLPANDPDAIAACRNKVTQKERLIKHDIPTARFAVVRSHGEALVALTLFSFPVVVKPAAGSGSVGVRLCESFEVASEHASHLLGNTTNERGIPIRPELLIEEFISGPEYSVETFGTNVVGITQKHLGGGGYFVETGHDFPADLPERTCDIISGISTKALGALGLGWGPAHIELRMTSSGPFVIEVNPRLAGGFIPELVRYATGIDLVQETVKLIVGMATSVIGEKLAYASIRFLCAPGNGTIKAIDGVDKAARAPGVVDASLYKSIGDELQVMHDFHDRIGHVIAISDQSNAASENAELAQSMIGISILQPRSYESEHVVQVG
jgi:biotin carboxylase